jgi:hypothetical protein
MGIPFLPLTEINRWKSVFRLTGWLIQVWWAFSFSNWSGFQWNLAHVHLTFPFIIDAHPFIKPTHLRVIKSLITPYNCRHDIYSLVLPLRHAPVVINRLVLVYLSHGLIHR